MLHDVVAVEPRDEFRLWVRFEDGAEGEVDLSGLAGTGVFARWTRNPKEFFEAKVDEESGTVVWPGGLDVAPDRMYEEVAETTVVRERKSQV